MLTRSTEKERKVLVGWLVKRKDGTMQCESQTAITDWL